MINRLKRKGDADAAIIIVFLLCVFLVPLIGGLVSEKIKADNQAVQRTERFVIEGVVAESKVTNQPPHLSVVFKDGRAKEFSGVPTKPVEVDKYYKLTYDGLNTIVNVEEVK
jgi:hypothetical protein